MSLLLHQTCLHQKDAGTWSVASASPQPTAISTQDISVISDKALNQ